MTTQLLREYVRSVICEAVEIGSAANRALASRAIVVAPLISEGEILVVVSKKDIAQYSFLEDASLPKIVGTVAANKVGDKWIIQILFADDPVTAVMLICAALERWQRVSPSNSVSPAATAVIKRYFEANLNNPNKIEAADLGPLKCTYLGPVGFNLSNAIDAGEKLVEISVNVMNPLLDDVEKVRSAIKTAGKRSFASVFIDPKRTKEI